MAHVTIHGNLASDPSLYDTEGGGKVAQLRVIENPRWRDDQGTWHSGEAEGHTVVLFGADAQHSTRLRKGDTLLVEGHTYVDTWTDEQGKERRAPKVRAKHIGVSLRFMAVPMAKPDEPMGRRQRVRTRAGQGDAPAAGGDSA